MRTFHRRCFRKASANRFAFIPAKLQRQIDDYLFSLNSSLLVGEIGCLRARAFSETTSSPCYHLSLSSFFFMLGRRLRRNARYITSREHCATVSRSVETVIKESASGSRFTRRSTNFSLHSSVEQQSRIRRIVRKGKQINL